jgi:hypothetical protein
MLFAMAMYCHSLHQPIAIATQPLFAVLLCLSRALSQLAQEYNLPDLTIPSSAATFNNFFVQWVL